MNRGRSVLVALALIAILYGSLYPFLFHAPAGDVSAVSHFLSTWRQPPQSRGDTLANLLFYFPLGFLLVQLFHDRTSAAVATIVVVAIGALLSASMELLQFYDAGRVSAMSDFYLNSAGTLLGAIAGLASGQKLLSFKLFSANESPFALLVLLAWLGWRLFPYEPVIDLHKYWASVKPVILTPSLTFYDVFRFATMWTAVAYLVQFGLKVGNPLLAIPFGMACVFFAKIMIVDQVITLPEVVGAFIALIYFSVVLQSQAKAGIRILAALFLLLIALERLLPFHLSVTAKPFEWIPFFSFLHGSMAVNLQSFMQKVFMYGAGLSMLSDAGLSLFWAASFECLLLLATSIIETNLSGRSAEITDAVIAVLLAVVCYFIAASPTWKVHKPARM